MPGARPDVGWGGNQKNMADSQSLSLHPLWKSNDSFPWVAQDQIFALQFITVPKLQLQSSDEAKAWGAGIGMGDGRRDSPTESIDEKNFIAAGHPDMRNCIRGQQHQEG